MASNHLLLLADGSVMSKDDKKAEVLNTFFTSVFNTKTSYGQETQLPEMKARDGKPSEAPIIQEEICLLGKLNTHKTMGLDKMCQRIMKEMVKELTNPLSIIYQWSRLSGEVPVDWKLANIRPT